jgi:hypothetical protein
MQAEPHEEPMPAEESEDTVSSVEVASEAGSGEDEVWSPPLVAPQPEEELPRDASVEVASEADNGEDDIWSPPLVAPQPEEELPRDGISDGGDDIEQNHDSVAPPEESDGISDGGDDTQQSHDSVAPPEETAGNVTMNEEESSEAGEATLLDHEDRVIGSCDEKSEDDSCEDSNNVLPPLTKKLDDFVVYLVQQGLFASMPKRFCMLFAGGCCLAAFFPFLLHGGLTTHVHAPLAVASAPTTQISRMLQNGSGASTTTTSIHQRSSLVEVELLPAPCISISSRRHQVVVSESNALPHPPYINAGSRNRSRIIETSNSSMAGAFLMLPPLHRRAFSHFASRLQSALLAHRLLLTTIRSQLSPPQSGMAIRYLIRPYVRQHSRLIFCSTTCGQTPAIDSPLVSLTINIETANGVVGQAQQLGQSVVESLHALVISLNRAAAVDVALRYQSLLQHPAAALLPGGPGSNFMVPSSNSLQVKAILVPCQHAREIAQWPSKSVIAHASNVAMNSLSHWVYQSACPLPLVIFDQMTQSQIHVRERRLLRPSVERRSARRIALCRTCAVDFSLESCLGLRVLGQLGSLLVRTLSEQLSQKLCSTKISNALLKEINEFRLSPSLSSLFQRLADAKSANSSSAGLRFRVLDQLGHVQQLRLPLPQANSFTSAPSSAPSYAPSSAPIRRVAEPANASSALYSFHNLGQPSRFQPLALRPAGSRYDSRPGLGDELLSKLARFQPPRYYLALPMPSRNSSSNEPHLLQPSQQLLALPSPPAPLLAPPPLVVAGGASSSPSFGEIPVIRMDRTQSHVERRLVLQYQKLWNRRQNQKAVSEVVEGRIRSCGAGDVEERIFLMSNETYIGTVSRRVAVAILLQRQLQELWQEPNTSQPVSNTPITDRLARAKNLVAMRLSAGSIADVGPLR